MVKTETTAALRVEYARLRHAIAGIRLDKAADKTAWMTVNALLGSIERAAKGNSEYTAKRTLKVARSCHIYRDTVTQFSLIPDGTSDEQHSINGGQ